MTRKQCEKYYKNCDEVSKQAIDMATYIVDTHCTTLDKNPILGTERDNLIQTMSYDIGFGEKIAKDKYLVIGSLSGIIITFGFMKLKEKIKIRKEIES